MLNRGTAGLPKPLRTFLFTLILLALVSFADAYLGYRRAGVNGIGDLWIWHPGFDFYDYTPRFPYLHSARFFSLPDAFPWVYPAPCIFTLYPFYLFSRPTHWHLGFLAFAALSVTGYLLLTARFGLDLRQRGLSSRHVLTLLVPVFCLSWPLYFALQRGNVEALLGIGIACGLWCFLRQRYWTAALLIGVVGSAKLYPLLFLALFLRPRRFRELAVALLAALLTTLGSLRFMEPDIVDAWRQIQAGVAVWTQTTALVYWPGGLGPDHSIFGALRQTTMGAIGRTPEALHLYTIIAGLAATAVFFLRVWRLPVFQQTLFLACAAILLPPASYDYSVIHLFVPWAYFVLLCVDAARNEADLHRLMLPAVLFGIVFAPLTFLHSYGAAPVHFDGAGRCFALLAQLVYAAWGWFPEPAQATATAVQRPAGEAFAG